MATTTATTTATTPTHGAAAAAQGGIRQAKNDLTATICSSPPASKTKIRESSASSTATTAARVSCASSSQDDNDDSQASLYDDDDAHSNPPSLSGSVSAKTAEDKGTEGGGGQDTALSLQQQQKLQAQKEKERHLNMLNARKKRHRSKQREQDLQQKRVRLMEQNQMARDDNDRLEKLVVLAESMVSVFEAGKRESDERIKRKQEKQEMKLLKLKQQQEEEEEQQKYAAMEAAAKRSRLQPPVFHTNGGGGPGFAAAVRCAPYAIAAVPAGASLADVAGATTTTAAYYPAFANQSFQSHPSMMNSAMQMRTTAAFPPFHMRREVNSQSYHSRKEAPLGYEWMSMPLQQQQPRPRSVRMENYLHLNNNNKSNNPTEICLPNMMTKLDEDFVIVQRNIDPCDLLGSLEVVHPPSFRHGSRSNTAQRLSSRAQPPVVTCPIPYGMYENAAGCTGGPAYGRGRPSMAQYEEDPRFFHTTVTTGKKSRSHPANQTTATATGYSPTTAMTVHGESKKNKHSFHLQEDEYNNSNKKKKMASHGSGSFDDSASSCPNGMNVPIVFLDECE